MEHETPMDAGFDGNGEGARDQLIRVALDLFAENGYAGTSIRDIAKRTGKSVSNVYHYFQNKEELWLAIVGKTVSELPEKLRKVALSEGEPVERFVRLMKTHLAEGVNFQQETRIFFINEGSLSPKGRTSNRRIQKEILDIYVGQLRLLQSHGLIRTRNVKILAFNILGVLNWHLRWFNNDGELSAENVHDEMIDFILYGSCGLQREDLK